MARVSIATVDRWARKEVLTGKKVGKAWRFKESDVQRFLGTEETS